MKKEKEEHLQSIKEESHQFAKRLNSLISIKDLSYWTSALITGIVAVGYANLFSYAEKHSHLLFETHPYLMLIFSPLLFLIGWWIVSRWAPEAQGSGIPQVMAAIESSNIDNRHPFIRQLLGTKTLIVKIVSSFLCVVGGGAVGREGPTIQIGAGIFRLIGQKSEKFSKHLQLDVWIVTGAAAGIAAAFNTPLGGLVYAIEELATAHFNRFKTSLISAVIIAGLASQWFTGSYLYLGYPEIQNIGISIAPWAIFVGIVCGLSGGLFGKILFRLSISRKGLKKSKHFALMALGCGLLLAVFAIFFEARALGSGREIVTQLLFKDRSLGDWKLMIARFISPIISYLSGCAGGIFAPSLAAGGSLGALLANTFSLENYNLFVLMGMISFLTGVTHAPFTSFVLVLEMTDRHSAIFPMMLTAVSALASARLLGHQSFYELIKNQYTAILKTS